MLQGAIQNNASLLAARLSPGLQMALAFLKAANFSALPDGRTEIDGDRVFALVSSSEGKGRQSARLEGHWRYCDVQFVIHGTEVIGIKTGAQKMPGLSQETDTCFLEGVPDQWLMLTPGEFVIFYPHELHAPLCGEGPVRKAVVKVLDSHA